ncbi:GLPGLI family protein [Bizionia argentinensis JUB59]|uniref:GLPGLI family protein n=1 Tax=Bizionia argentinensis JUB59 TaxID=1046627 RepID=G2EEY4_9FLAO|nr:GLPGLI family protein [Bizionia argentinensis]EGV43036.1 GLPGLI family protein [Bizionia argentinensis JUB59]
MNFFKIIVILLITSVLQSQNIGYVEYGYVTDLGITYETTGKLNFNTNASLFIQLKSSGKIKDKVYNQDDDGKTSIAVIKEMDVRPTNYTSKKEGALYSIHTFFKKTYLVKEVIPKIAWQLTTQTKKIGQFNCQKATGVFRGRNYTVWFTNEIPLPFGPWKLNGLPGLILEAKDDLNQLYFFAKKVVLGTQETISKPQAEKEIELKTFISLKDKLYKDKEKVIATKVPRNSQFKFTPSARSSQKEITYEWEIETD